MITICLTYFKSLTLANLAAALYSLRQQDMSCIRMIVIVDNDTADDPASIGRVIDELDFPVPVKLLSYKHDDPSLTHAWSTNRAIEHVETPWVLFTRADYLLDFGIVDKFIRIVEPKHIRWRGFVTSNGCHLQSDVEHVEQSGWRQMGPGILNGTVFDYTVIDAGVWMGRCDDFAAVEGLNEGLTAWGHAQTDFQHRLYKDGVEFVRVPETLFFHPWHGGPRDIDLAHKQLAEQGGNLKDMWARYEGVSPY